MGSAANTVVPAEAGTQGTVQNVLSWTPACAGVTKDFAPCGREYQHSADCRSRLWDLAECSFHLGISLVVATAVRIIGVRGSPGPTLSRLSTRGRSSPRAGPRSRGEKETQLNLPIPVNNGQSPVLAKGPWRYFHARGRLPPLVFVAVHKSYDLLHRLGVVAHFHHL